jgi:MFS family permease
MPRNPNPTWLAIALLLVSSLTIMAGTPIAPALPELTEHFKAVPNAELLVKLVLTLPGFFIAAFAPVMGVVADRFGRKPLLLGSAVLYGVAGISGYFVDSLTLMLVGRALLGVAVAGIMTTSMALVGDYFAGAERHRFMGVQASFTGLGGVAFLTLGGLLASVGWRMPFLIYLAAPLMLPLLAWALHEPTRAPKPLSEADGGPIPEPLPVGPLTAIYASAFAMMVAFYLVPVQIPFHLKALAGVSPTHAGMAIAATTLASAIVSPMYPKLRARLSPMGIMGLAWAIAGLGLVIVSLSGVYWQVIIGLAILGAGTGMHFPNISTWLMAVSPEHLRGRLSGGLTTAIFLGQFLSPVVGQLISQAVGIGHSFGVMGLAVGLVAAVVGASRLRRTTAAAPSAT